MHRTYSQVFGLKDSIDPISFRSLIADSLFIYYSIDRAIAQ